MADQDTSNKNKKTSFLANLLKLSLGQIIKIDKKLAEVGQYGEVRIVVQNGKLRYINKVESDRFEEQEEDEE